VARASQRRRPRCGISWRRPSQLIARAAGPGLRLGAMATRIPSISAPYCTPEGQAVSQARQARQPSRLVVSAGSSIAARPSATARMSAIRPRGAAISRPESA
jgi:hypothetical protein